MSYTTVANGPIADATQCSFKCGTNSAESCGNGPTGSATPTASIYRIPENPTVADAARK